MPHESSIRYLDAATYARQVLGDDAAAPYFDRLCKLARTNSLEELQSIIRGWRPPLAKVVEPEPVAELFSKSEQWGGPCKHFGGTRKCPTCLREETAAGVILAGAMKLADEMWHKHRKFVLDRMHTELDSYTNGDPYLLFGDLEQEVWATVAARIAKYEDRSQPLAWLKHVVRSVVADHFKHAWAKKRGAAVTEQLIGDPPDPMAEGIFAPPPKPTRPAGAAPDKDIDLQQAACFAGLNRARK